MHAAGRRVRQLVGCERTLLLCAGRALAVGRDQRIAAHRLLQLLKGGPVLGQRAVLDRTHWNWALASGP